MSLVLTYGLFALIATLANIGSQELSLRLYTGNSAITLSVLAGTFVGLIVKYSLDKKYIFHFQTQDLKQDGRIFLLYTLMGLATTALFWGTEYLFHIWFSGDKFWRYLGGVLGLAIGYITKYFLDKTFVFK